MNAAEVFEMADAGGGLDANATQLVIQELDRLNDQVAELQGPTNPIFDEVLAAYEAVSWREPPINSAHEGYALLFDECEVLWAEIRKRPVVARSKPAIYNAARAVAAACIRLMVHVRS